MPNRIGGTLSLPGSLDIGFLDIGRHLPCQHFQCTTGSVTLYALPISNPLYDNGLRAGAGARKIRIVGIV